MKPFADHLAVYAASHRHPHNRLTHYVGVPTIIFALMVLLSLVRLPVGGEAPSLARHRQVGSGVGCLSGVCRI